MGPELGAEGYKRKLRLGRHTRQARCANPSFAVSFALGPRLRVDPGAETDRFWWNFAEFLSAEFGRNSNHTQTLCIAFKCPRNHVDSIWAPGAAEYTYERNPI